MGECIVDNKLVITTEPKSFCFDLPKDAENNLEHEIYSIIKHKKLLAEHKIKNEVRSYCPNKSMDTTFMNMENSKKNGTHKFVLNFSQSLNLRSPNEHVAPKSWSIYYTWKIYDNSAETINSKIIAPAWNDELGLPDGSYSVSDIHDYVEHNIKKHETLPTNPPFRIYINRINKRLLVKIKDGYKVELQTPETMKLFGSTKKIIDKTKNGENVPSLEVVEVVFVQWNLVDKQYQQKSEALCTFASNKSNTDLLNVEPSNLMLLETYNIEFDEIIITFYRSKW